MEFGFPNQLFCDSNWPLGWRPAYDDEALSDGIAGTCGALCYCRREQKCSRQAARVKRFVRREVAGKAPRHGQREASQDWRSCAAQDYGEHRDWVLLQVKTRDVTLQGLADELAIRGLKVDYRTMWNFIHREGLSFKKNGTWD